MTEQEKLLFNVLSAMYPHDVIIRIDPEQDDEILFSIRENGNRYMINDAYYINEVKPYLRPMSDITDEERIEYAKFLEDINGYAYSIDCVSQINWLNAHHFDYCGLIEKGLALKAHADMYEEGKDNILNR